MTDFNIKHFVATEQCQVEVSYVASTNFVEVSTPCYLFIYFFWNYKTTKRQHN